MAAIKPFAALRPKPAAAPRICELPYDVVSTEEARVLAAGNRESFFYISKPEIDLPAGINPYDPRVYAKGRAEFQRLIAQGSLQPDAEPCFYLYRQIMGGHAQVGLVAAASCEDYLNNIIKKHELTRPDKEDDRVRHIEALNAQTGPAFLVYRAAPEIDALVARRVAEAPEIDFTSKDGVRHSSWVISRREEIDRLRAWFAQMPALYIADGHHRSAAAARIYRTRKGAGDSAWFLAVIFPHNQVQILPYNRVLKDLNGHSPERLLTELATIFHLKDSTSPAPARKHELSFYLAGRWRALSFRPECLVANDPLETLDATLAQKLVLGPVFGIDDPRTSRRVNFVGGIRGIGELERLVDRGDYACALALYPTSIEDLMSVADAEGTMPPKSTWFEPKLRDGMFSHWI
jgi:uncharacterized protein (DUF1015 family)